VAPWSGQCDEGWRAKGDNFVGTNLCFNEDAIIFLYTMCAFSFCTVIPLTWRTFWKEWRQPWDHKSAKIIRIRLEKLGLPVMAGLAEAIFIPTCILRACTTTTRALATDLTISWMYFVCASCFWTACALSVHVFYLVNYAQQERFGDGSKFGGWGALFIASYLSSIVGAVIPLSLNYTWLDESQYYYGIMFAFICPLIFLFVAALFIRRVLFSLLRDVNTAITTAGTGTKSRVKLLDVKHRLERYLAVTMMVRFLHPC